MSEPGTPGPTSGIGPEPEFGPEPRSGPRIVLFAHNRFDSGVLKRIDAFRGAGCDLVAFSFRRDGAEPPPPGDWADHDLGPIEHRRHVRRIGLYARALRTLWRARCEIRTADVIYARNLDIFLLAWAASTLAGASGRAARPRMVYEAIDVHDALTSPGPLSAVLRRVERRVLARCDLLVTSSPGFITHYFTPRQGFTGPWFLVENKLVPAVLALPRATATPGRGSVEARPSAATTERPVTLVWAGVIRCQKTLSLLREVALAEPERVSIRIHGRVSRFLIDDFEGQLAGVPNLGFHGPYTWPEGLATVYAGADLVWAQDFEVEGGNSDWLLPNRLYEAGYFGVPVIAVAGTETGRCVVERGLGHVVTDARVETVVALLRGLDRRALGQLRDELLGRDPSAFVAGPAETRALLDACIGRAS